MWDRAQGVLVALAEQTGDEHDRHAIAARYEWGSLLERALVAQ